jgi:hypothetical protein
MTKYRGVNKVSIDTFTGTTLSSTTWTNRTGADVYVGATTVGGVSLATGMLHIEDQAGYPGIISKTKYDVTNKILAVKWRTKSGAATGSTTEVDLELDDGGNDVGVGMAMYVSATPSSASQFYESGGLATISDPSGSSSGMGSALADNTWVGLGMVGPEKILRCFTSTDDGATWTYFRGVPIGGTFDPTSVAWTIECGHSNTPDLKGYFLNVDEAALFSLRTAKVRVGGAWVDAYPKVRVGGAWVSALPRRRVGGSWV